MATTTEKTIITVRTSVNAPVEKVWKLWTDPKHILHWNYASDDWYTPRAENDLRTGGKFLIRMEAKDNSTGFDFSGEYSKVRKYREIGYTIADGRKVSVTFIPNEKGNETKVTETFEAEQTNPLEMQHAGWKAILENFKNYAENTGNFELLHFEVTIDARPSHVYRTMLDKGKWTEWTAEFDPTSHFKGSWDKGSKILFMGTDKDGKTGGMVSKIRENIPNRFVSIEHIGEIRDDKEVTNNSGITGWEGALENYTFMEKNGKTLLSVDIDAKPEFRSWFKKTWPKALHKLREICEEKF